MKRISLFVCGVHLVLLCWMALWMPARKIPKKPMAIRTVMEVKAPAPTPTPTTVSARPPPPVSGPPPKKPSPTPVKQSVQKPPSPKKPTPTPVKKSVQKPPPPKKPAIPAALLKQLETSLSKLEDNTPITKAPIAKGVPKLQIDEANASIYASDLIQCLQSALTLPGVGAIKVELTLRKDGSYVRMRVLESKNTQNKAFLETHLAAMKYPPFSGELKNQKEHAFVITFCNH